MWRVGLEDDGWGRLGNFRLRSWAEEAVEGVGYDREEDDVEGGEEGVAESVR